MPKEIKIFIALWVILSSALIITACVTDVEDEETLQEKDCTYYDYDDNMIDSVQIMLKKGYRICD